MEQNGLSNAEGWGKSLPLLKILTFCSFSVKVLIANKINISIVHINDSDDQFAYLLPTCYYMDKICQHSSINFKSILCPKNVCNIYILVVHTHYQDNSLTVIYCKFSKTTNHFPHPDVPSKCPFVISDISHNFQLQHPFTIGFPLHISS